MSEAQTENCTQALEDWRTKTSRTNYALNLVILAHLGGVLIATLSLIVYMKLKRIKFRGFVVAIILLFLMQNITGALILLSFYIREFP